MADFGANVLFLDVNLGTNAVPTRTSMWGANHEVRWSDISTQDGVGSAAWVPTLRPAATSIVSYTYGFTVTATATNQEQTFDIPEGNPKWIACSFLNAGPNNAQVKINNKGGWVPLFVNIPQNIDFTGADEKICRISYQCPVPGNTAVITVVGKY